MSADAVEFYVFRYWHARYIRYENARNKTLTWLRQSINLSNASYLELVSTPGDNESHGAAVYGCYRALLAVAGQNAPYGVLTTSRGDALTPHQIAVMTRLPEGLIVATQKRCLELAILIAARSLRESGRILRADEKRKLHTCNDLAPAESAGQPEQKPEQNRSGAGSDLARVRTRDPVKSRDVVAHPGSAAAGESALTPGAGLAAGAAAADPRAEILALLGACSIADHAFARELYDEEVPLDVLRECCFAVRRTKSVRRPGALLRTLLRRDGALPERPRVQR